jgi:uncharacterized protein (TIGR02466 family)
MANIENHFVTRIWRGELPPRQARTLNRELEAAILSLAEDDEAGRAWCREHKYAGYTSYASLNDLPHRMPPFAELQAALDEEAAQFARALDFDLGRNKLVLDSLWVNALEPGGFHTAHIHPHSVLSGTYYVAVPRGASAIRFEDPRLGLMMAAPPKKPRAKAGNATFVSIEPAPGSLLLWESWLRHEVPTNNAKGLRLSVSFNYRAG